MLAFADGAPLRRRGLHFTITPLTELSMNAPANRIDLLEHEAEMLLDFLGDLPQDSWGSDSACEGWTVADEI